MSGKASQGASFAAFLAELARAPDAPVQTEHLPAELASATRVDGRYRIEKLVGRGGMGEVYRATDTTLGRTVAIKLAQRLGPRVEQQWLREAEALARLTHPNVVEVFRVGTHAGRPFIVMEWIEGETLADWALGGARPWPDVLALYQHAGRGLAAAHAAGLVHRDFKPHNVLLGHDARAPLGISRVCVADFGLAALRTAPHTTQETPAQADARASTASRMTRGVVGTFGYMAPEQFAGAHFDLRSDQFSFCAALFEGLCGRLPYGSGLPERIHARALTGEPIPMDRLDVPRWLERALRRGLQPAPGRRFADMHELLDAIDPRRRRRRRRRLAGLLAAVAAVFGGWAVLDVTHPAERSCRAAASEIDATWNRERAQQIVAAFTATDSSLAASGSANAIAALDEHAASWAVQRMAACDRAVDEAADVRPELACLERSRVQLEATIDVLAHADREVVARSDAVLAALPRAEACERASVLAPADAEPADPDAADEVREARKLLASARALLESARLDEAFARADEAVVLARSAGFDPVIAEALLVRGSAAGDRGLPGDGVADLEHAYWTATAVRHDEVAADAARGVLARMVARPSQYEDAQAWSGVAEAAERRARGTREPSWKLHRARASAAFLADRYAEATREYEAALRGVEAEGGHASTRSWLLGRLSTIEYYQTNNPAALELAEQSLAIARAELPADHPTLAHALGNLGQVLTVSGRRAEAVAPAREALAIFRRLYGPTGRDSVQAAWDLADVLSRAGDLEAAVVLVQDANEAVATARAPVDGFQIAYGRMSEGRLLIELGRFADAIEVLTQAIDTYEQADAATTPNRAYALTSRASARAFLSDFEGAIKDLDHALEILGPTVPPTSMNIVGIFANRGAFNSHLGRHATALRDFDEATQRLERGGIELAVSAMIEGGRADALLGLGRREEAVEAALRAVDIHRRLDPEPNPERLRTEAVAAETLLQAGEPALAKELVEQALANIDPNGPPGIVTEADLTFELARATFALGDRREGLRLAAEARSVGADDGELVREIDAWLRDP